MSNVLDDILGGAPPKSNTISLDAIRIDGGTQMRASLDEATVREYMDAMTAAGGWGQFPAIVVYHDGDAHWLGDGFHRAEAARRNGLSGVPADIRAGTRRDAVLHAAGANASHGLRRSPADKRRSVEALLRDDEWREWSDREIARRCNVSADLVGAMRKLLEPPVTVGNDSEPAQATRTYTNKHGAQATMKTAAIGKTPTLAQQAQALVPAVVEYLRTYRDSRYLWTWRSLVAGSAAHTNSRFWADITKEWERRGIIYRDDTLKTAIKAAFAQLKQEQAAPPQPPVSPEQRQYESVVQVIDVLAAKADSNPYEVERIENMVRACVRHHKWTDYQRRDLPHYIRDDARHHMEVWQRVVKNLPGVLNLELRPAMMKVAEQIERGEFVPFPDLAPTVTLDDLPVVDSVTVRVDADGTPNMDWEPEEWEADQRRLRASAPAPTTPKPGELPADLAARGWQIKQVAGIGKYYCNNPNGPRATGVHEHPEDAIAEAYTMQRDLAWQNAGAGEGLTGVEPVFPDAGRSNGAAAKAVAAIQTANRCLLAAGHYLSSQHDDAAAEEVAAIINRLGDLVGQLNSKGDLA